MDWNKWLKAKSQDRWVMLERENRLSYDHTENWIMSALNWKEEELKKKSKIKKTGE
jgi:hypothetical protein